MKFVTMKLSEETRTQAHEISEARGQKLWFVIAVAVKIARGGLDMERAAANIKTSGRVIGKTKRKA